MAHIVRFKIDGLLGRTDSIEFSLDRSVNIFFGENGCGKTTLLKILQSAMSLDGEAMIPLAVERAEVDIYSINEGKILTHIWDRKSKKGSLDITHQMMLAIEESNIPSFEKARLIHMRSGSAEWKITGTKRSKAQLPSGWKHAYLPTTRLYSFDAGRRPIESRANNEDRLNESFADLVNKRWLTYYAQVLKEVKRVQEEGLRAALYHSLAITTETISGPILNPHQAYERVKKFLGRQSQSDAASLGPIKKFIARYEGDESLRKVVDNINNVEERIEHSMAPIQRFSETINNLFSRGKKLQTNEDGLSVRLEDGASISPALLSSGEKHLVAILLQAMTIGENSIIIDEPELSMHIDWQHTLAETIIALNPSCQLIAASHSPEIMANIPDGNIFKI
ncbi:MAG: AAA family ATPase [Aquabacterium sp.]|uniref:AAA family ATPase n=1 Tax=Aquabacterium sp. TaxID=1872578 RepID=UPI003BCB3F43